MSSILRALKKLDEEAVPREGRSGEQNLKMRQSVNRRTRTPRIFNRYLFIISLVLLISTAALIIMNTKGKPAITKIQDTSPPPKKHQETPAIPETSLTSVTRPPSDLTKGTKEERKEETKKKIEKVSPQESTPPGTIKDQSKPSTKPAISAPGAPGGLLQAGRMRQQIQTANDKNSSVYTNQQIGPEKKNKQQGFILNGILWSDIPEKRVALINDRYLNEGDRINGVSVIRIEKKSVTLQSGSEKWTIKLKK